jgi:hypothetical protein
VERGLTKSTSASTLAYSLDAERYVRRPEGRYDTAERLLRGQVFTTRPRPGERDGVQWTQRDLDALAALRRMPLASGAPAARGGAALTDPRPGGCCCDCEVVLNSLRRQSSRRRGLLCAEALQELEAADADGLW